jgi:hypothetical protein
LGAQPLGDLEGDADLEAVAGGVAVLNLRTWQRPDTTPIAPASPTTVAFTSLAHETRFVSTSPRLSAMSMVRRVHTAGRSG